MTLDKAPVTALPLHPMHPHVWAKHLSIARAGAEVLTALAERRIFPVVVKGGVTAHRLYDDPSERMLSDLDLRVTATELVPAREIGRAKGWKEVLHSRAYGMLSFEVLGQLVEFERFVGPPYFSSWSVEELRRDAVRRADIFSVEHLEPRFEDHVLITAINIFKDKLLDTKMGSLEDLRRFAAHAEWNERAIMTRSRAHELDTVLATVAEMYKTEPGWDQLASHAKWSRSTRAFVALYTHLAQRFPASMALRLAMRTAGSKALLPRAAVASLARLIELCS